MAIHKLTAGQYSSLTQLYNLITANKAGTFLEDLTIELSNNNKTLTISNGTASMIITVSADNNTFDAIVFNGKYNHLNGNGTQLYGKAYLTDAVLCSNGLMFSIYGNDGAIDDSFKTRYYVLTTESDGGLAFIAGNPSNYAGNGSGVEYNDNGFFIISENSITNPIVITVTLKGAQLTSLAPLFPSSTDDNIILPNAYVAVYTQQSNTGFATVIINGQSFITNGRWYIKDGV